jgi:single-strand DNA-binding protein
MASLNRVQLIGNAGKDPEGRYTNSGSKVVSFSLGVNNTFKTKNGETRKETEWFNLEVWGKLGDIVQEYVHKGSQIYVEGRLKTDKFEDKTGEVKYYTKVVVSTIQFLGSNSNGNPRQVEVEASAETSDEDSIPF